MSKESELTLTQINHCANLAADSIREGRCDIALSMVTEAQLLWKHIAAQKREEKKEAAS